MDLSIISCIFGGGIALFWLPVLAVPARAREWATSLPRSKSLGWALTAVCMAWSGYILKVSPLLADLKTLQNFIVILAPVSFLMLAIFLHELLAARAFGGLLLLVPRPVIDAAFVSHAPLKLYVVILAYVVVILGMIFVVSPYLFRRWMLFLMKTDARARIIGACGILLGMLAIVLGLTLFKTAAAA